MKIYEITIKPQSGFGTPLKGDTIFGHFCWQIAHDEKLIGKSVDALLADYQTKPFAIFSSAYPRFSVGERHYYALKTPSLPPDVMFNLPGDKKQKIKKRKDYKAKKWMIIENNRRFSSLKEPELKYRTDQELLDDLEACLSDEARRHVRRVGGKKIVAVLNQFHNTINRRTGTTGLEGFAPFSVEQQIFFPETALALFVGIDESALTIEQIRAGLERIGSFGFGKDASTGLGRFTVEEACGIDFAKMGSDMPNACYTLAPCVPEIDTFSDRYFTPFTRFGRHGDVLAKSGNPFKNPIIMADEGGIFMPKNKEVFNKPYIGRAITNISKAEPKSVAQGYSLYIPVKVEV